MGKKKKGYSKIEKIGKNITESQYLYFQGKQMRGKEM